MFFHFKNVTKTNSSLLFSTLYTRSNKRSSRLKRCWLSPKFLQKGGDPSTASATDALLRLHPDYCSYLRPPKEPSGITNSRGVTGGEYKTRERIQRAVADARLLVNPTS